MKYIWELLHQGVKVEKSKSQCLRRNIMIRKDAKNFIRFIRSYGDVVCCFGLAVFVWFNAPERRSDLTNVALGAIAVLVGKRLKTKEDEDA